jgi:excisionase family DNA binding protein
MSDENIKSESPQRFEPLLDDNQAALLLGGLHPKTLQRMARRGQVPAFRVGKYWRYRASELDEWLKRQRGHPEIS